MITHDTIPEMRARNMLTSMKIPYSVYPRYKRDEWRCSKCTLQSDIDSANFPDPDNHELVMCRNCQIEMQRMEYEVDILAFKIDAIEIDGLVHSKGIHPSRDARRQAFLEKKYGLRFHRFPNKVIMQFPEVFEEMMNLLRELREK